MKKIYNSPAIETIVLSASLMQLAEISGDNVNNQPPFDPFNPAPGRKPF